MHHWQCTELFAHHRRHLRVPKRWRRLASRCCTVSAERRTDKINSQCKQRVTSSDQLVRRPEFIDGRGRQGRVCHHAVTDNCTSDGSAARPAEKCSRRTRLWCSWFRWVEVTRSVCGSGAALANNSLKLENAYWVHLSICRDEWINEYVDFYSAYN